MKPSGKYFLAWYEKHKRDLPWRHTNDPYKIWVSEIMLQQTQVSRVQALYEKFLKRFPTVQKLSMSTWPHILSVVRGMGYYARFRNMQKTARIIMADLSGKFPNDYRALRKLPGIGDYTVNAVLAFAFGRHVPVIDTNVRRVLKHFFGNLSETRLRPLALKLCPSGRERDFFQALMDFAQTLPKEKRSISRRVATESPHQRIAVALIRHHEAYFLQSGEVGSEEDERRCLKRLAQQKLGIEISVRPAFQSCAFSYRGRRIKISFHRCQILLGRLRFAPAEKRVAIDGGAERGYHKK